MPFEVIIDSDPNKEPLILGGEEIIYVADSFNLRDKDGGLKKLTPARMVTKAEYDSLVAVNKIDQDTLYLITTT